MNDVKKEKTVPLTSVGADDGQSNQNTNSSITEDKENFGVENKTNFFDELKGKNLFADRGTVNGLTVRNVVVGYDIVKSDYPYPYQKQEVSRRWEDLPEIEDDLPL